MRLTSVKIIGFAVLVGLMACKKTQVIENGKAVKINYTLTVDGAVVDTSTGKEPLSYVQGNKMIIPGLEEALAGLKKGDKKQVTVPPEKGYGVINAAAQQKVPLKSFNDTKNLKVGTMVRGMNANGPMQAKVLAIGKKDVTLDFNHPLASKILNFDVEVVSVEEGPKPTKEEPASDPAAQVPEPETATK